MSVDNDDLDFTADLEKALDSEQEAPERRSTKDDPFPRSEDMPDKRTGDDKPSYVRDGRRFVKQESEAKAEKAAEQSAAPPVKAWKPLWYKDEYGEWDKHAEPFRKALEQREKEAAAEIEKRGLASKAWEPLNEALRPFEEQLRTNGQTPQQFMGGLVSIYTSLQSDPVGTLDWLCQQTMNTDLYGLVDYMSKQGVETKQPDPMQTKLADMERKLAALEQQPQIAQHEAIRTTISEWSKDKPHWNDLERTVLGLIQADPSVRERFRVDPKATLDSLYEQASWAHPTIRQRILEDQRKADVARARGNSFGTRDTGGQSNAASRHSPKLSLEQELSELLDGA